MIPLLYIRFSFKKFHVFNLRLIYKSLVIEEKYTQSLDFSAVQEKTIRKYYSI